MVERANEGLLDRSSKSPTSLRMPAHRSTRANLAWLVERIVFSADNQLEYLQCNVIFEIPLCSTLQHQLCRFLIFMHIMNNPTIKSCIHQLSTSMLYKICYIIKTKTRNKSEYTQKHTRVGLPPNKRSFKVVSLTVAHYSLRTRGGSSGITTGPAKGSPAR